MTEREQPTQRKRGPARSVDQAIIDHREHWVLMEVTEFDEKKRPASGVVLSVSDTNEEIWRAVPSLKEEPGRDYFVFFAQEMKGEEGLGKRELLTHRRSLRKIIKDVRHNASR